MPFFPFQLQSNTSPSPFLAATPLVFTSAQSFPIPLPRRRACSGGGQSQRVVVYFCCSLLLILFFCFSAAPSFLFPLLRHGSPMGCSPSGLPLSRIVSPAMPQQCPLPYVANSIFSTISPAHHSCRSFLNLSDRHGLPRMAAVWREMGCSHRRWSQLELAATGPGRFVAACHGAPHSRPPPHPAGCAPCATLHSSAEFGHIKILAVVRRCD